MTSERAIKLAHQVAQVVLQDGPHSEDSLRARIVNQVAELLMAIDWRVLPGDGAESAPPLLEGQLRLPMED